MKRRIALDTETTGLKPEDGHRMVEFGAVEIIDGVKTGNILHFTINPERDIPFEVVKIHGIDNEKVKGCPTFKDVADEIINFIKGAELIIHNAKFDIKFLNAEFERVNKGKIWDYVPNVICTLELDKRLFAEHRKHNLDAICERLEISLADRTLHGALIDSTLLADAFIKMNTLFPAEDIEADLEQKNWVRPEVKRYTIQLASALLSEKELLEHDTFLVNMAKNDKVTPIFSKTTGPKP